MTQRLRALFLCLWIASPGCAAVSLFSHDHTHTHHHHYDAGSGEVLSRLESIEHRVGGLEVGQYPATVPAPAPLYAPTE